MKTKSLTGTPWELAEMFIASETKSVTVPRLLFLCSSEEAGGKAERCRAAPQCSHGVVSTWEYALWVGLSRKLIFTAHSYFSQGAAEVQANPDKGEKTRS